MTSALPVALITGAAGGIGGATLERFITGGWRVALLPYARAAVIRNHLPGMLETLEQLGRFPGWKLHSLKGDLKGFWSQTVTGNWRLIFRHDENMNTASDIDLIDYH